MLYGPSDWGCSFSNITVFPPSRLLSKWLIYLLRYLGKIIIYLQLYSYDMNKTTIGHLALTVGIEKKAKSMLR
jgi:hypothetical protein